MAALSLTGILTDEQIARVRASNPEGTSDDKLAIPFSVVNNHYKVSVFGECDTKGALSAKNFMKWTELAQTPLTAIGSRRRFVVLRIGANVDADAQLKTVDAVCRLSQASLFEDLRQRSTERTLFISTSLTKVSARHHDLEPSAGQVLATALDVACLVTCLKDEEKVHFQFLTALLAHSVPTGLGSEGEIVYSPPYAERRERKLVYTTTPDEDKSIGIFLAAVAVDD